MEIGICELNSTKGRDAKHVLRYEDGNGNRVYSIITGFYGSEIATLRDKCIVGNFYHAIRDDLVFAKSLEYMDIDSYIVLTQ